MAHFTIMSGSASLQNKHLRPDFSKRDSNSASCQNIDRTGIEGGSKIEGDQENTNTPKRCFQKYKNCVYFGSIGLVLILTVILIILAATGAFDTGNS